MAVAFEDLLAAATPKLGADTFRWTVGTRRISESEWLLRDDDRASVLSLKDQLHETDRDKVVVALPSQESLCQTLQDLVVAHLVCDHSNSFVRAGHMLIDTELDRRFGLTRGPALPKLGRFVTDDFAVMRVVDGSWVMVAATVCFPSRWDPLEKLGKSLSAIHEPVPHYASRLDRAVTQLFDKLSDERILLRIGWNLVDSPDLVLKNDRTPRPDFPSYVRLERQTLRRLPGYDAVVFTIDTRVRHLETLPSGQRDQVRMTASAADRATRAYKGWPNEADG